MTNDNAAIDENKLIAERRAKLRQIRIRGVGGISQIASGVIPAAMPELIMVTRAGRLNPGAAGQRCGSSDGSKGPFFVPGFHWTHSVVCG